jgi:uridine kinase
VSAFSAPVAIAPTDAVLVFDGVFLQRPELADRWDLRIFVSTAFERTVDRALMRERGTLSAADISRRWRERYIPSQEFYFAAARPGDHADIVVHNDDLQQPAWEIRIR